MFEFILDSEEGIGIKSKASIGNGQWPKRREYRKRDEYYFEIAISPVIAYILQISHNKEKI